MAGIYGDDDEDLLEDTRPQFVSDVQGTTRQPAPVGGTEDPRRAAHGYMVAGGRWVPRQTLLDPRTGQMHVGPIPTVVGSHALPRVPRAAGAAEDVYSREMVDRRAMTPGAPAFTEATVLDRDPRDPRSVGGSREIPPTFFVVQLLQTQPQIPSWICTWLWRLAEEARPRRMPPRSVVTLLHRRGAAAAGAVEYAETIAGHLRQLAAAGEPVVED